LSQQPVLALERKQLYCDAASEALHPIVRAQLKKDTAAIKRYCHSVQLGSNLSADVETAAPRS